MHHQTPAAAAKSLQSCPTLWDPIDGSPPGSPVPGILQARPLEWVAISSSNAWKWKSQFYFPQKILSSKISPNCKFSSSPVPLNFSSLFPGSFSSFLLQPLLFDFLPAFFFLLIHFFEVHLLPSLTNISRLMNPQRTFLTLISNQSLIPYFQLPTGSIYLNDLTSYQNSKLSLHPPYLPIHLIILEWSLSVVSDSF